MIRLLICFLCALSPLVQAADLPLTELMTMLSQSRHAKATFIEQKYIALLDKPVESSGELNFVAPDRLEKRTLQPKPEAILLHGDALTLERGKRSTKVSLQDYPDVAVFVESIRATLAGDQKALETVWKTELDGNANRWTLKLTPLGSNAVVAKVRIQGNKGEVRQIDIEQRDGDRSVMQITRVP